jgi:hypothetical protein
VLGEAVAGRLLRLNQNQEDHQMKSEFHAMISDEGHTVQMEFVPNARKPKAIYIVVDGQRVARRGRPGTPQARTWVPMIPGCEVRSFSVTHRSAEVH